MELIDTHAHLDDEAFDADRDAVVARSAESGVATVLSMGTTLESSRRTLEIAHQYPQVYAAVGIHPNHAAEAEPGDFEQVEDLLADSRAVAVGETGLDRYWDFTPFDVQVDYFARHIALARKHDLPFVVHCREAEDDVVAQLREAAGSGPLKGVMHSFCGSLDTARTCLELGLDISFAGMVTFKKSDALRAVAAEIPSDRLLVETDSPYLAPEPNRGKRNEPAYVKHTAERLAEVRGVPLEELAAQTTANARRVFGI